MRGFAAIVLLAAGCADSATVRCGDVVCPPKSRCGTNNECIPVDCGDGAVTGVEVCDPAADLDTTCADLGFYLGNLACSQTCELDTTGCSESCGDTMVNGAELCDGIPPSGFTCADFGFDVGPLGCSNGCSPGVDLCASIGWQAAPGGASDELHAVWASGLRTGIAVGLGGTILRATDGIWLPMTSPIKVDLFGVTGGASDAFAVGAAGTILKLDPMSDGWTVMTSPTTNDLYGVYELSPQNVIAVGAGGTIVEYNGSVWQLAPSGTLKDLTGIWGGVPASGPSLAIAVGAEGTVLRQIGSGSWAPATIPTLPIDSATSKTVNLNGVYAAGGTAYIVGEASTLLVGTLSSATFQIEPFPGSAAGLRLFSVWARSGTEAIIGSIGRVFFWDGASITEMHSPTTRSIFGVSGVGPARAFAVTRGGSVLEYNGTDRSSEPDGTAVAVEAVFRIADVVIGVGGGGIVVTHANGTWEQDSGIVSGNQEARGVWADAWNIYVAVAPSNPQLPSTPGIFKRPLSGGTFAKEAGTVTANGIFGLSSPSLRIYAAADTVQTFDGVNWSVDSTVPALPGGASQSRHGVWASADGTWFIVGDGGYVAMKSGTDAWQLVGTPTTVGLTAVWGFSSTDVFAVGQKGMILHWDGMTWRQMYTGTGENLTGVHGSSHGDVYAVGTSDEVLHFDGVSWSRMSPTGFDVHTVWSTGTETLFVGAGSIAQWIRRVPTDTEERCQDPWDNDGKDGTNCADPDCDNDVSCLRGGACETAQRIDCASGDFANTTYSGVARIDDLPCLDHSTPGPEASHRFVADRSGPVTIAMTDPSGLLDLVVMPSIRKLPPGAGACDVTTCTAAAGAAGSKSITFMATAGDTYHVFVDGPLYQASPFTLNVSCPAP